jgi:hypothetical protein
MDGRMPDDTTRMVLLPSRPVRTFTSIAFALGAAVSGMYAAMTILGHLPYLLVSAVLVVLILAVRPIAALGGRTVLDEHGILACRPVLRDVRIPYDQVARIEARRGLVTEWVVLYRTGAHPVRLRAPSRLLGRLDPVFNEGLSALCSRTTIAAIAEHVHLGLARRCAEALLTVTALVLILIDPPWKSDAWPLRPHAARLPDTCHAFDARVHGVMPGARVDQAFSHNDDSDPRVKRHTCRWTATYAADGKTFTGVSSLTIEYELDHGTGNQSDADQAHHAFQSDAHAGKDEWSRRLARMGDEARVIVDHPGRGFTAVTVAARKANVEEKVAYVHEGTDGDGQVTAVAARFARSALSQVQFR